MRFRHIAAAVLGIGLIGLAVSAAGAKPSVTGASIDLNDGTIQVGATVGGLGSWVPYTITIRNLGDQRFEGDMLLVNRPKPGTSVVTRLPPIAGAPQLNAPIASAAQPVAPPDAAYQVHLLLDSRHKKAVTFIAPSNYSQVEVVDSGGRLVAEVPISDRNVLAVGVVSETGEVADAFALLRFGDLGVRTVSFGATHPLPATALGFAGLVAVVFNRTDGKPLTIAQGLALRDFVGFGGTLIVAGSAGLPAALRGIPSDIVPLRPTGTSSASLQALADLGALAAPPVTAVATGTLAPRAQPVVTTTDGTPLVAELTYGAGRAVELTYDPTDGATVRAGIEGLAWSNALARGMERLPGNVPVGGTLMEPEAIPSDLLPNPQDAPLPSVLVLLGLVSLYVLIVGPATFLALRSVGRPTLFWVAAPLLAVAFSLLAYVAGQSFQGGVRDHEVEFLKLGPGNAVSRLSYHGITFPLRGLHRIQVASGSLAAPLTLGYPALELSCHACPFQVAGVKSGVEEHVIPGEGTVVVETGVVYGSVRVVGEASTGTVPVSLDVHLTTVSDRIVGIISNNGSYALRGVRVYAFYGDVVHSALVTGTLVAGGSTTVNAALTVVNDFTTQATAKARLAPGVAAELVANAAAERALTRAGEVAVVGFAAVSASVLTIDGVTPPRETTAAVVETFPLESASGRLGNWVFPRLNSTVPLGGAAPVLLNTYDLEIPAIEGLPVFRFDSRVYSDVEVYDWTYHTWRSSGFSDDSLSPIVKLTAIHGGELTNGKVRVRVREAALTWGQELVLRFPDEKP